MRPLSSLYAACSAALGGRRLVGTPVCVDWGGHNGGWYAGQLMDHDAATGEYEVRAHAPACAVRCVCVRGRACVRVLCVCCVRVCVRGGRGPRRRAMRA
jgi:hypothetical protein